MLSAPLMVLASVTAVFSGIAQLVTGPLALPPAGAAQLAVPISLLIVFSISTFLLLLGDSIRLSRQFVRGESGHVDTLALARAVGRPSFASIPIVLIAGYGIGASTNLAEVYRLSVSEWKDPLIWAYEEPVFSLLLASPINAPGFWDVVYNGLWVVLFIGLAALARSNRLSELVSALCAVVMAFHLTRYFAIWFPTAGPVFHRPELFDLVGTGSAKLAAYLREYMAGHVPQTGMLPGTQALPSLHVGLAWCAVLVMANHWQWTLWLTLPWFVLNWLATMFLGWHYFVDGVGGIILMSFTMWCSRRLVKAFK